MLGLLRKQPWRLLRSPLLLWALAGFLFKRIDHGGLKSAVIRVLLGGLQRQQVDTWTADYVRQVVPARLFADALAVIQIHRAKADILVLLSASPDLFVPALGAALGFDQVLCTGVRWDADRLHGALTTTNRRGFEKLLVLQALRGQYPGCHVTGYGNSLPDLLHLRACDAAVYVNADSTLSAALTREGLRVVHWH